jgi:hypothetical protein
MKKRTYDTPVCLLLQTGIFDRIKFIAEQKKISMSNLIRDGIKLKLAQIDEENNKF